VELVYRAAIVYFFLWFITRVIGKKELGSMSPFELVVLVTMGDLIQQGVTGDDRSITGAVLAVSTMSVLIVFTSFVSYRSQRLRTALEGFPVIVVRDGMPIDNALRAERLTLDEITGAARDQGIDDLRRVRVGILEPEGKFSFIIDDGPIPQQTSGSQEESVN